MIITRRMNKGIVAASVSLVILVSSFAAAEKSEAEIDRLLFGSESVDGGAVCVCPMEQASGSDQPDEPVWDEVAAAFSESFEYQEAGIFINGAAYPGLDFYNEGALYVLPSEFFPAFLPDCAVSDDGSSVTSSCGNFEFCASVGELYVSANERCLFCEHGVLSRGGAVAAPLSAVASALGASVRTSGDDVFVTGDASAPAPAEGYYNEEDLFWLSRIISCESMSESLLGKIAVGNVVLNRVASDDFPSDVKGVVFDSRYGVVQFSPVAGGHIFNDPDPESVVAAKLCLEGVSLSDRILYFMNPSIATSSWISDNREAVMTIGRHTFYS